MNFITKIFSTLRDLFWRATRQWVSATGVALATAAAISFLAILALDLTGWDPGTYAGIISYVLLPALFVLGLLLIPIGLRILRRGGKAAGQSDFPVLDFNDPRLRTTALVIVLLTVINLMIVSVATFRGLQVMETDSFCGTTCHNVMQPEAVAHQHAPHADVHCVDCHIGEGTAHFVKAKLRGATQMLQFLAHDYDRPIPQPTVVRPAVCTRCHNPNRYTEDRLHINRMYGDQEAAVQTFTIFWSLVGGLRDGKWQGVHQHNGMKVRYLSDPKRLTISEVEVTRPDGSTDRFVAKDIKAPAEAQWREMGCTDCHNRPAHGFSTPQSVVNSALSRGAIAKDLPFIGREAVAVLKASYPSRDEARTAIPAALLSSYLKLVPTLDADGKAKVDAAGKVLAEAWTRNNFPEMNVTWGTYVSFLQHTPGCYRCHDGNHENAKGQAIPQNCSGACHNHIATDEEKPEVMDVLYP